jgi:hypothetical protein
MLVQVDVNNLKVEVRCAECDQCMNIEDQYENNDTLVVVVSPCEECEEEKNDN